jgi:hypothetical protein
MKKYAPVIYILYKFYPSVPVRMSVTNISVEDIPAITEMYMT